MAESFDAILGRPHCTGVNDRGGRFNNGLNL